jgi:hypothetical protein
MSTPRHRAVHGRGRRHGAARRAELARDWQEWAIENLLLGVAPNAVLDELVRRGVSRPLAERSVAELAAHPALDVARRLSRVGRRLELVQRLLTLQATHAVRASGVERRATPTTDEFFDHYYATSTPVIFTDLVTNWPALGKWTPEYFRDHFRDVPVNVTTDRESDPIYDARTEAHTQSMTMGEFAERVLAGKTTNDFYMVARNKNVAQAALAPLFDDVRFPEGWFEDAEKVGSSALWFGPPGTVTPLHHDASSILFCQVYGRKRFRLASPLEVSLFEGALAMYSSLDLERPGDDPRLAGVTFKDFTLEPGEALFIPAGWWHHVRALDPTISFAANHFARPNNFDAWYRPGEVK